MVTVLFLDKHAQKGRSPTAPCSLGIPDSLEQSHDSML